MVRKCDITTCLRREEREFFFKVLILIQSVYGDFFFFNLFLFPSVTLSVKPRDQTRGFCWDDVMLLHFRLHKKVNHRDYGTSILVMIFKCAFLHLICVWSFLQRQIIIIALRKLWSCKITKYYFLKKFKDWKASLCQWKQIDEILDDFVLFAMKTSFVCPCEEDCWLLTPIAICPFLLTDKTLILFSHVRRERFLTSF